MSQGLCLALGGTNARVGTWSGETIENFQYEPTPTQPFEFFGWMAHNLLEGAEKGSEWAVIGIPGPVKTGADDIKVGPCANVDGLKNDWFNFYHRLRQAEPATGRLFDQGFRALPVNDGDLAAHAVAVRYGAGKERVGAVINGTGIGFGAAERMAGVGMFRTLKLPLEVGHIALATNPQTTFETTTSGPALEATYGRPAKSLGADHQAWRDTGILVGKITTMMGLVIGVEIVVPTGGVGGKAAKKYRPHLERYMEDYRRRCNGTQKTLLPEIRYIAADEEDPKKLDEEVDKFELFGANSIMRAELAAAS